MAGDSHFFCFPVALWVNLKREEKARGGLNTDAWAEHCVSKGHGSEEVL